MAKITPELIRAQALQLRGADVEMQRAEELATEVGHIIDAALGARNKLDFNDEPARFAAVLAAAAHKPAKRK